MSPEFRRLAALSTATLRLNVSYLPRSSELLCGVTRSGVARRDLDLDLALIDGEAPEQAVSLLTAWTQNFLFGYPESMTESRTAWRLGRIG